MSKDFYFIKVNLSDIIRYVCSCRQVLKDKDCSALLVQGTPLPKKNDPINSHRPYDPMSRPLRVPEGTRLLDFQITTRTLLKTFDYSIETLVDFYQFQSRVSMQHVDPFPEVRSGVE